MQGVVGFVKGWESRVSKSSSIFKKYVSGHSLCENGFLPLGSFNAHFTQVKFLKIISELEKAGEYLAHFEGGYSDRYVSRQAFLEKYWEELEKLKNGDQQSLEFFYQSFVPTFDWDDFTDASEESIRMGNELFSMLQLLYSPQKPHRKSDDIEL